MAGLENAAAAFDGNNSASEPAPISMDSLFGNSLKGVEVDEGSPPQGGGDDTLPEGYVPPQEERRARRPAREEADPEEVDPEDLIYGDDPDDPEAEDGDEDEDDEDDEDEQEGAELSDEELTRKVKITVDGEEQEVTLREALDGYIRTDTFHQRLNSLNEAAGVVKQEALKVVDTRQKANALLSELEEAIKLIVPQEIDWDKLFAENPAKARSMQKSHEELQAKLADFRKRSNEVGAVDNERQQREFVAYVQGEQQKFNALNPHWRGTDGEVKRKKDLESMARSARAAGFEPKEIAEVYDSRMLNVLLKASKYDRMMAARPKPNKGRTPAKSGAGRNSTAPRGSRSAATPARSGGSAIDQAAGIFTDIITATPRRRR